MVTRNDRLPRPPRIGLPLRMDPGTDIQYLSRQYGDAVAAAGGVPVLLPLLEGPEALRPLAGELDGILLTGSSSDVDPTCYGAVPEPACGGVQPLRDRLDFFLLEEAFARRQPVLAICFGMQSLNVFLGGSLIQDIPTALQTSIQHQNPGSKGAPSHPVDIVAGSVLEPLAGGTESLVNSTHHQAIDRIGRGLEVIARAPDGIVEAVAVRSGEPFVLGVQWHPEKSFTYDAFSRAIFELFIDQCRSAVAV
jgi:putative glutamine amidotransferase